MPFAYDNGLVILSIGVAIFGAFTSMVMTAGVINAQPGEANLRLIMGALTLGLSAWAMHFIGLLALKLPVRIGYDVPLIIASAALPIVLIATSFFITRSKSLNEWGLPLSTLIMGGGLAGMFYLGVSSIRGGVDAEHNWFAVAITVAIAIQAAVVALWLAFRRRGLLLSIVGAVGLGLILAAMHYAGMELIEFAAVSSIAGTAVPEFSEVSLAWTAAVLVYLLCSVCLAVYALFQFLGDTK